jgi:CheY-like chemotaxis protein
MHVVEQGAEASRPKILVAEDHPAFRQLLAEQLRAEGYDVVEVADGATLTDEVAHSLEDDDNPRDADLIVTDVRMPGGSGLWALERLRRDDILTPVVVITAFGDAETHLRALRLGANAVLTKPFKLQELIRLVHELAPLPEDVH